MKSLSASYYWIGITMAFFKSSPGLTKKERNLGGQWLKDISPIITYIVILQAKIQLRRTDRVGMLFCYLAIPIQYTLAYKNSMFIWIRK